MNLNYNYIKIGLACLSSNIKDWNNRDRKHHVTRKKRWDKITSNTTKLSLVKLHTKYSKTYVENVSLANTHGSDTWVNEGSYFNE